jgi:HEAT repeat protein
VVKLFNGYERHPTREDLLQVAPEESLVLALHDLYQDASARPYVRTNALAALALFPSDVTYSLLLDALTDPATSATARRAVIQALAGGFGPRAADDIARVGLAHDDLHTRRVTAQALLKAATPTALAALEARLDVEAHPLVRADLARALAAWPPSASPLAPTPARVTTQDAPPAKR